MDFKKTKAETTTISRDLRELESRTGNVYETVMILAKRSNQIASEMKERARLAERGETAVGLLQPAAAGA